MVVITRAQIFELQYNIMESSEEGKDSECVDAFQDQQLAGSKKMAAYKEVTFLRESDQAFGNIRYD